MMVFVDTSALYALLDRDDENHSIAARRWQQLLSGDALLVTSSYVLVETCASLQARLGLEAVRAFQEAIVPLLDVHWVSKSLRDAAQIR